VGLAAGHLYNHVISLAEARRGESLACGQAPTWCIQSAFKQAGQLGLALGGGLSSYHAKINHHYRARVMDQRKDEGVSIIGLNYRRGSQVYGTPVARVTPSPHDMYRSLSAQGLRLRLATCDYGGVWIGRDSSGEFFVLTLEFIIRFLF